jgi:hypothetical protein
MERKNGRAEAILSSSHPLLSAWRLFDPTKPPFILPGDEALLDEPSLWHVDQWRDYLSNLERGNPADATKLCLGLLPMPFIGNLRTASIFLLMLNPGARPHDFFGESDVKDYRAALLKTLKQERDVDGLLDPHFAWHGRYGYWQGKLSKVFERRAANGRTYGAARRDVESRMAALELLPYHSTSYRMPDRMLAKLRSVRLIRSYVMEVLVPRAKAGNVLIIVGRAAKKWGEFPKSKNIVVYSGPAARSAHLTPDSAGGKAILRFLASRGA